jgi:hypothetical protein
VIVNNPNNETVVTSEIYNLIISEGLRGLVFKNIGEETILCIQSWAAMKIGEIEEKGDESRTCRIKLRSHPRALSKKFPGFNQVTGYKYAKHITTDALISMKQLKSIMEEIFLRFPSIKEVYNKRLIDFPKSSYNIPKTTLLIKMTPGTKK